LKSMAWSKRTRNMPSVFALHLLPRKTQSFQRLPFVTKNYMQHGCNVSSHSTPYDSTLARVAMQRSRSARRRNSCCIRLIAEQRPLNIAGIEPVEKLIVYTAMPCTTFGTEGTACAFVIFFGASRMVAQPKSEDFVHVRTHHVPSRR